MRDQQSSRLKTCALVGAAEVALIACLWGSSLLPHGLPRLLLIAGLSLLCLAGALVLLAGAVVMWRARLMAKGQPDLFLRLNATRSEEYLAALPLGSGRARAANTRSNGVDGLRVGDEVEVKSLAEIRATLDADGCIAALPFQREMEAFCGRRFRVFRVVDKIYDYGRSRKLRNVTGSVSLAGVRCAGTAHGGCQAQCSLMWREEWLRKVPPGAVRGPSATSADTAAPAHAEIGAAARAATPAPTRASTTPAPADPPDTTGATVYSCQFTQLTAASTPIPPWNIAQDLRPLWVGNVTFPAFCIALLTRIFNYVQRLRGGVPFPWLTLGAKGPTPSPSLALAAGQRIRVLPPERIAATLDAGSRNRGLWFDLELLRHSNQVYTVNSRVDRIIDIVTCRMLNMKTPSITLTGATASGEFLHFCPQHEYNFWREAWLEPQDT
jgi:hypothetical protein